MKNIILQIKIKEQLIFKISHTLVRKQPKRILYIQLIRMSQGNLIRNAHLEEEPIIPRTAAIAQHTEPHIEIGQLVKSFVYGGVDGATNVLIVILSSFSSGVHASAALGLCISICIGDGISMGLGDYLSKSAEIEFIKAEEQRQDYEVENLLEFEKKEIIDIYTKKGFISQDSTRIAELYATNKKAMVNIMMLEELKLAVVEPGLAVKCGVMTFFSFIFFGFLPALPYVISSAVLKQEEHPWIAAICIGVAECFSLGFAKAVIIGINKWKSALQFLFTCAAVTVVGYAVGFAFPVSQIA